MSNCVSSRVLLLWAFVVCVCLHFFIIFFASVRKITNMASEIAKGTKSHEQVVAEFQTLRSDQRKMVSNIAQLELDLKEHK